MLPQSIANHDTTAQPLQVGVLALQGAFREHKQALERLGAHVREVRLPEHLAGLDGLVIPGGESTTMAKLIINYGFDKALAEFYSTGAAIWGTCAGAITIASTIEDHPDQLHLNMIEMTVSRNAYGRQVASFEADVPIDPRVNQVSISSDGGEPLLEGASFRTIFIRAPRIISISDKVTVLAEYAGDPIMVMQDKAMATVFHPELTDDDRIHAFFLDKLVKAARATMLDTTSA
ncbi:MAG: pyridoxal 5'-phosphate synthase glutaminase subunit PdxT [Deinococcota bacterium]